MYGVLWPPSLFYRASILPYNATVFRIVSQYQTQHYHHRLNITSTPGYSLSQEKKLTNFVNIHHYYKSHFKPLSHTFLSKTYLQYFTFSRLFTELYGTNVSMHICLPYKRNKHDLFFLSLLALLCMRAHPLTHLLTSCIKIYSLAQCASSHSINVSSPINHQNFFSQRHCHHHHHHCDNKELCFFVKKNTKKWMHAHKE